MKPTLGFIGVGSMGAPLARNLLRAGYPLVVRDVDGAAVARLVADGAQAATTPADMTRRVAIVFMCLPSLAALSEVVGGPNGITSTKGARICVNFSTAGPPFVEDLASRLSPVGIELLDCPITGGAQAARDGTLSITVSGKPAVYDEVRPMLNCVARDFFCVGERPGQAQLMKLINNMLSFTAFIASCEAMVLGVKAGMDPEAMIDILNTGTGRNSATTHKFPQNILPRTFDYGARLAISHKDIALCMEQAQHYGVPMFVGSLIKQMIDFGVTQMGADVDICKLITIYENWSGVQVMSKSAREQRT